MWTVLRMSLPLRLLIYYKALSTIKRVGERDAHRKNNYYLEMEIHMGIQAMKLQNEAIEGSNNEREGESVFIQHSFIHSSIWTSSAGKGTNSIVHHWTGDCYRLHPIHNKTNRQTKGCCTSTFYIYPAAQHCIFIYLRPQAKGLDTYDTRLTCMYYVYNYICTLTSWYSKKKLEGIAMQHCVFTRTSSRGARHSRHCTNINFNT